MHRFYPLGNGAIRDAIAPYLPNIAGVSLAHDLKAQGVAVAILHPELEGTEMIGCHGDITPDQAADRLSPRIDGVTLSNSGTFWHSNGDVLPW